MKWRRREGEATRRGAQGEAQAKPREVEVPSRRANEATRRQRDESKLMGFKEKQQIKK
jgi:hypothetical protein